MIFPESKAGPRRREAGHVDPIDLLRRMSNENNMNSGDVSQKMGSYIQHSTHNQHPQPSATPTLIFSK